MIFMEFAKEFGVNPSLIAAQVINFLIILFLLKRFLYKPLLSLLNERKTMIQQTIKNAEEAEARLAKVIEEEKAILRNAQAEAAKILEDARDGAEIMQQEAKERAKLEAIKMLTQAKVHIHQQTQEAEKQLAQYVSRLAVDFLRSALTPLVGQKDQEEVLIRAIKKLGAEEKAN